MSTLYLQDGRITLSADPETTLPADERPTRALTISDLALMVEVAMTRGLPGGTPVVATLTDEHGHVGTLRTATR